MTIKLRNYQGPFYQDIINKFYLENVKRLLAVLPTGGGKSVIIGKLANELTGRTLILTHRVEILIQNYDWLNNAGILASNVNTIRYDSTIVIAMVQTLFARIKTYGIDYLGHFNNIILDEVHILIFEKVFKQYNYKRLIGFTGTPVVRKNKYSEIDGVEFVEEYTLSELFDDIVCGPDTQDLIDIDYLVQDYNITLKLPDFDKLRESNSNPDGYTAKSMNDVYYNTASLKVFDKAYYKYCEGKKTLVFNSSIKVNKFIYKHFKDKGINVKMFDSSGHREMNKATGKKYTREEIIEWFRKERKAMLIGVNVFTTGFDVDDVEVVVVNRATKSLALWIQMVGRGSRITDKIYKNIFTVIDLGQNIYEHGMWSKRRDWNKYFRSDGKKLRRVQDLLSTWECEYCGALNVVGDHICNECDAEKLDAMIDGKSKKKKFKQGELELMQDMPPPKAGNIIRYCKSLNQNTSFAFQLLERKICELFIHYNISDEYYSRRKIRFDVKIDQMFKPIYFAIYDSDLKRGNRRRLKTELERVISKVDKLMNYGN